MSALLRLIHSASLLAGLPDDCRTATPGRNREVEKSCQGRFGSRSGAFRGALRATSVHFALSPEDAAPVLVLGQGHSAFDTNPHALPRLGIPGKELFQERHGVSVSASTLRRISASEGLLIIHNSRPNGPATPAKGIIRACSTAARVSAHQCTVYADEVHGTPDR